MSDSKSNNYSNAESIFQNKKDNIYNFELKGKELNEEKLKQANSMLGNNFPLMMKNHFTRSPASWKTGNIKTAEFLKNVEGEKIGNMYANWFSSSIDVARYIQEHFTRLKDQTHLFQNAFYNETTNIEQGVNGGHSQEA